MFLHFPFDFRTDLRQSVLILNTLLLIAALIIVEIGYAGSPHHKRQELRLFLPLFLVLAGLLVFAALTQRVGS